MGANHVLDQENIKTLDQVVLQVEKGYTTPIRKSWDDMANANNLYFIADRMITRYFTFCFVYSSFVNIHPFLTFRPATQTKKVGTVPFRDSNEVK